MTNSRDTSGPSIEQGMEQTKKAVESFVGSVQEAATSFQAQTLSAQRNTKDLRQKVLTFTELNIATSLDYGQRLLHAKNLSEVVQLQTEYVSVQMQNLIDQAKELADAAAQAMRSGGKQPR